MAYEANNYLCHVCQCHGATGHFRATDITPITRHTSDLERSELLFHKITALGRKNELNFLEVCTCAGSVLRRNCQMALKFVYVIRLTVKFTEHSH